MLAGRPASLGADPICGLPLEPSCRICEGPNCEALEDIYHATGGPAWSVHTGWLATSSPCEWFGASCSDGRLSSLALPNNGLNGALPEDIAKLQYLVELDFSRNALEGHVPAQIGALSRLSKLDLSVNNLAGALPLSVATLGAGADDCNLQHNPGLCIPDDERPSYQAIGKTTICGLPLRASCSPGSLVRVTSLRAQVDYDTVTLLWSTTPAATDIFFEVQMRVRGVFETIGTVAPVDAESSAYAFALRDLDAGAHVFRLRQRTQEGALRYSEEVTVVLFKVGLTVGAAHPNPFSTSTVLRFASGTD